MNKGIAGHHIVRFGTAADEKYLLGDFLDTYDQLVINANMVAHMPSALALFLSQKAKGKPYFIDPQTHAFQHDISHLESTGKKKKGDIKRSIQRLLDEYGEPLSGVVGKNHGSVLPDDFSDATRRHEFCERVLAFQEQAIEQEVKKSPSAKYYKYLEKKGTQLRGGSGPTLLVAPYFYISSNTFNLWLQVNLDCMRDCRALGPKLPLASQVVLDRDILKDANRRNTLIKRYTSNDIVPDVFLVWVDSFPEHDATEEELRALVELLNGLGKAASVVNLYGGFFSTALMRCNIVGRLCGVAHGLEYGEDRGVVPVGGGIPTAKFYYPALHMRLSFRAALRAVRKARGMRSVEDFLNRVCDCAECRKVIRTDPEVDFANYGRTRPVSFMRKNQPVVMDYPLPETREHSVRHYMWCKSKEYQEGTQVDEIVATLREAKKTFGRSLGLNTVAHCQVWANVLEKPAKP